MKRLQIMIDLDLDDELARIAHRDGTSKAAIIRRLVRKELDLRIPLEADPLSQMCGVDSYEPTGIDDVVYR